MYTYEMYLKSIDLPGIYVVSGDRGTKYIGSSRTSVLKRWRKHLSDLRRNAHHNTPLQESYNNGEEFKVYMHEYHAHDVPLSHLDRREEYCLNGFAHVAVNVPNSVHRARRV